MKINIQDDFDLLKIAQSGQCFRVKPFSDGTFRFVSQSHLLYIKKEDEKLYDISCDKEEWDNFWFLYFALDQNYENIRKNIDEGDDFLKKSADYGKGIRILRQDPFEALISFIISQRKSIPAIKGAVEALSKSFGDEVQNSFEKVFLFPTAEQLKNAAEEELSACKLGYRTPYIQDALKKISSKDLDLKDLFNKSDEELLDKLKTVCGVGNKVANCVALFAYNRIGLAPIDTWMNQIIEKEYKGINPLPKYGKYAGIMQQYLFYYAIQHKKEIKA